MEALIAANGVRSSCETLSEEFVFLPFEARAER